jgi:hypothetical protein
VPDAALSRLRPASLRRRAGIWAPRARGALARRLGGPGRRLIGRLARWRPRVGGRRDGARALAALTLLSRRTAPRLRTVIRSERRTSRLRTVVVRRNEAHARSVVQPPRAAPSQKAPSRRPLRSASPPRPGPRMVSAPGVSLARHTTRRETWVLPLGLRERIERTQTASPAGPDRALAAPAPGGAAEPAMRRLTSPAPTLVRAPRRGVEAGRPARLPEPAEETAPLEGGTATAQRAPQAAGPTLDDLVDRVLRRIERRAVAQRERLGRA